MLCTSFWNSRLSICFGSVWVNWPKLCENYAVVSQKFNRLLLLSPMTHGFPDLRPIFVDAQVKVHEILRSLSFTRCNLRLAAGFFNVSSLFLYVFCILAMSLGSPRLFCSTSMNLLICIGPSTGLLALDGHHNSMGALEWGSKPSSGPFAECRMQG